MQEQPAARRRLMPAEDVQSYPRLTEEPVRAMTRRTVTRFLPAVVALLAMGLAGCASGSGDEALPPPAVVLASVDADEALDEDDPIVAEYQAVVTAIASGRPPCTEQAVAAMALQAHETLTEEAIDSTVLEILQTVDVILNTVRGSSPPPNECPAAFALAMAAIRADQ